MHLQSIIGENIYIFSDYLCVSFPYGMCTSNIFLIAKLYKGLCKFYVVPLYHIKKKQNKTKNESYWNALCFFCFLIGHIKKMHVSCYLTTLFSSAKNCVPWSFFGLFSISNFKVRMFVQKPQYIKKSLIGNTFFWPYYYCVIKS